MYKNKKISVCLPCKNEAKHLKNVVEMIPKYVDEIIVVSNNSTDNTIEIAKNLGLKIFEDDRSINGIGSGFAYQTAIKYATGDYIFCADADGTYPFEKIEQILEKMMSEKLDFVYGSRYPVDKNTKIPNMLKLGVWVLNIEIWLFYGVWLYDSLSGMFAFDAKKIEQLEILTKKFPGDWNHSPFLKIKAFTNPNIKASNFHISQNQRMGSTKQKYFKTGFGHLFWIFLYRFGITRSYKMDTILTAINLHQDINTLQIENTKPSFNIPQKQFVNQQINSE